MTNTTVGGGGGEGGGVGGGRVNEDLRVAKARVSKYREIQAELQDQLSRSQAPGGGARGGRGAGS